MRINSAVLAWRRADGNTGNACGLCRNGVHQERGYERCIAALTSGDIETHGVNRQNALTENCAVALGDKPGFFLLIFVKGPDIIGSSVNAVSVFRRNGSGSQGNFMLCQTQGRFEVVAVKLGSIGNECGIPFILHACNDL